MSGKSNTNVFQVCLLICLMVSTAIVLTAQSLDPSTPQPISSTNLLGKIAVRDIGDSRFTNHYYTFVGTPGDLLITIQSRNLNGDLDVFTANGLRPLLKVTLYAESTTPITKGIYLRRREELILRIEARSPNDDEGTYQLFFGGSFEALPARPDLGQSEASGEATSASVDPKAKRVSSVGARLPEPDPPVTEVASTPTPEPTPVVTESTPTEKVTEEPPKTSSTGTPPRSRRQPPRRTTTPVPVKPRTETTENEETAKKPEGTETEEAPVKPKSTPRTSPRRTARGSQPTVPAEPAPEPESGPRLVIETNDGTLINRSMSTIRRVTVENGQVVVTGRDGKIDRILLANVVRMSIAP